MDRMAIPFSQSTSNVKLQCKHIPDRPIIEFIGSWNGEWCFMFHDHERSVFNVLGNIPWNLAKAKMGSLICRGLVDGCACGCRGDFVLTEKGKAYLNETQ